MIIVILMGKSFQIRLEIWEVFRGNDVWADFER